MEARILAAHGEIHIVSDTEGIAFQLSSRTVNIRWGDITGAGLAVQPGTDVTFPVDSIELLGGRKVTFEIVPFGGKLAGLSRRLATTHRALMIGDGGNGFQVWLPIRDAGTESVIAEFESRLGDRWRGDTQDMGKLRKQLRIRTSWGGRLIGLLFVIVVLVGGFLAIAAWVGVKELWEDGDLSLIRPYTVIPLLLWAIAVWYLMRRLGHRKD